MKKRTFMVRNIQRLLHSNLLDDTKIVEFVSSLKRTETLKTCMTTMFTAILQDVLAMFK